MSLAGQKDGLQEACLCLPAEVSIAHQPHHRTQSKMLRNPGPCQLLGSGEAVMDALEGSFIPTITLDFTLERELDLSRGAAILPFHRQLFWGLDLSVLT